MARALSVSVACVAFAFACGDPVHALDQRDPQKVTIKRKALPTVIIDPEEELDLLDAAEARERTRVPLPRPDPRPRLTIEGCWDLNSFVDNLEHYLRTGVMNAKRVPCE